ncbi:MAG TPA: SUF system NifU family Fe-S cluster assembly protein [Bacteroidota bacterium]|nr:SUF system NifU family Fe-S cluster assembly protein [Candidatus Kapabacteria bacterium]HRS02676.1 SUF system NifU family Fe-S cluster assembly protein [Bacteroidota bacterium]HRT67481.1 SUF system NifU family Fe-S cluster assembly protein [Bacteroidota bacterium]
MDEINELYQEVILDHNKNPRNYGKLDHYTHFAEGFNPLCGDHIDIYLDIEDNIIKDIKFISQGCAISKSSASIMTTLLKGKTVDEAKDTYNEFLEIVTKGCENLEINHEDLEVFCGVSEFPTRVKCATLGWHTFEDALKNNND